MNDTRKYTREMISNACLVVYMAFFALATFLASSSGGLVLWYGIMGVWTIPLIISNLKWQRILGVIALIIAIALAVSDYNAGKQRRAQFLERLNEAQKQQEPEADSADKR